MKINQLIKVLELAKKELGEEAQVIFCYGSGADARDFDIGDKGRGAGTVGISVNEIFAHTDGWGRYGLPICRIARPEVTKEMADKYDEGWRKCGLSDEAIAKNNVKQAKLEALFRAKEQREIKAEKSAYRVAEAEMDALMED